LPGKAVVDSFQLPLPHDSIGIAVLSNVETIAAFLRGRKRDSWRVNLERDAAPTHQGAQTNQDSQLNQLLPHAENLDVGFSGKTQHRTVIEFDLCPAVVSSINAVSGLQWQIDASGGPIHFIRVLEADVPFQIGQPGDAEVVLRPCDPIKAAESKNENEKEDFAWHDCLLAFLRLWFKAYTELDAAPEAKYQKTVKKAETAIARRHFIRSNRCR
jgi:hypothetical protein